MSRRLIRPAIAAASTATVFSGVWLAGIILAPGPASPILIAAGILLPLLVAGIWLAIQHATMHLTQHPARPARFSPRAVDGLAARRQRELTR
ncbi:hypothetical protein AB0I61_17460 [Polymorphospora rubra]|uniref:hypothetical protein n=1 Tax=Polymorphospora rubra TaxID=338584 RepID=UPI0033C2895E